MTQLVGTPGAADVPFSDEDFQALATLARREFGLNLAQSKKPLVYSRLSRRLKARKIAGFSEYMKLLDKGDDDSERMELISALTTNVTNFFREDHHFQMLRKDVLPACADRARNGKRLRIWSAGCSSGQEAYCIAMSLLDVFPEAHNHDAKILATDIDPQIVAKAKTGRYAPEDAAAIPEAYRKKWVTTATGGKPALSMSDDLRRLITFAELNLISQWPFQGPFDAIFCRNVAIYFDQETQQALWQRFCDLLMPGGYLFIGHSERITGPATSVLRGVGITSYQKTATATAAQPR
ncbi:CheR family methyltransferase [Tropicibacter oceani]|uniref:Chemotaxis protein methyltransferase n=1 Tax=Tropicibacter oceani TaxID=3058420 RepID=A0ABY8QIC6_9RHOB|nr:protein-glutamate O-methyltransferase [Tropicibacter oceani]WGW03741.1 protein-glutamate O-methyltransferase [Tropicibacter oceani]